MKLILGDNPFFGINHSVGSKQLLRQEDRFAKSCKVILAGVTSGFDQLMLSAHTEGNLLIRQVTPSLRDADCQLRLALVVPYPHTINNLVAEYGYLGGMKRLLGRNSLGVAHDLTRLVLSKKSSARKSFIRSYIKAEIQNVENDVVSVASLCLHNVFTDLLLGLGRTDVLVEFIECCESINVRPVIISQNPTRAMSIGTSISHVVCFSYNSIGYMVNPSLEEVDSALDGRRDSQNQELWAMQILASGNIGLKEAFDGSKLENFDGILYATNREERIASFVDHVQEYLG